MSGLDDKIFDAPDLAPHYVLVRDFVDVRGRKALAGRTGRAVGCPDTVSFRSWYAGEVRYVLDGAERVTHDRALLVDIADLL